MKVDPNAHQLACEDCGREVEWVMVNGGLSRELLQTGDGKTHVCSAAAAARAAK